VTRLSVIIPALDEERVIGLPLAELERFYRVVR
jgi:hypothetical protein